MSLKFDHVVLSVKDLKRAIAHFEAQGFQVIPGGKHGGGLSHNALIFFEDGTFIELFALRGGLKLAVFKLLHRMKFIKRFQYSKKYGLAYRFYSRALELPEGITDLCLLSDDHTQDYERINEAGVFLTKPLQASRKLPNGKRVKWNMFSPFLNELPFMRSDYVPARARDPKQWVHPNGINGIEKLYILALDYKDTVQKYELVLGQKPFQTQNEPGKRSSFMAGPTILEILKPADHPTYQEALRGRGIGLYGIGFKNAKKPDQKEKDAHGLVAI